MRASNLYENQRSSQDEAEARFKKLLESAKDVFHPDLEMKVPPNSLIIVAAASGHGKSTFIKQCIVNDLQNNRKVLMLSNEMPEGSYIYHIRKTLKAQKYNNIETEEYAKKLTADLLKVIDNRKINKLNYWDTLPIIALKLIEGFRPDVVYIDHISNCTLSDNATDEEKTLKQSFQWLPRITDSLQKYVNDDFGENPPIFLAQQGNGSDADNGLDKLRGGKNTVNTATHMVSIKRNKKKKNITTISVDKDRFSLSKKHSSEWQFDLETFEFTLKEDDEDAIKNSQSIASTLDDSQ